jgi:hypothetical protein
VNSRKPLYLTFYAGQTSRTRLARRKTFRTAKGRLDEATVRTEGLKASAFLLDNKEIVYAQ